jgi:hypothetical protein
MKKTIKISAAVAGMLFFNALIINTVSAQTTQKAGEDQKLIPASVMKVAQKSCANCHIVPGSKIALSVINLSAWDKYSPEKQAAKAQAMCNIVTKEKMPPKKFKSNNPDAVPNKDDLKILCDWAASLQVVKK